MQMPNRSQFLFLSSLLLLFNTTNSSLDEESLLIKFRMMLYCKQMENNRYFNKNNRDGLIKLNSVNELCFKNVNVTQKDKFKSMHMKKRRNQKMGISRYHKVCYIEGSGRILGFFVCFCFFFIQLCSGRKDFKKYIEACFSESDVLDSILPFSSFENFGQLLNVSLIQLLHL